MRKSLFAASLLATAALAGATHAQNQAAPPAAAKAADKPQIGDFGFDTAGMDHSIKPGDDFTAFAGGIWQKNTEIPADRASYGMFHVLQDLSLDRTRIILEAAAKTPGDKIGDYYASFIDEAAADAKGIDP